MREIKLGISAKLVISFGIIAVFLDTLALYSVIVSQKTREESVGRGSLFLVKEMLTKIDQNIYYRIEELQKYSKEESLQKNLLKSNADFEKLDSIEEYIKRKDREWISVPKDEITPFMQKLINDDISQVLKREFIEFYEKKYGYKLFAQILLTNRYRANIAQTGKTTDYRQDDEQWWHSAQEKGFSVNDIYNDEYFETHGIAIGIRIDDERGNFIGVMKTIIVAEEIMREVEIAIREYETTKIKLLTKEGKVIYATEPFNFLEDITVKDFFKELQEESGFFIVKEGARNKLVCYTRAKGYRTFEGLQWILLINHDVEEVLSSAFILRNNILLVSLILVVTTVLVVRLEKLALLGKLAGSVGHELRNPLGSIKNATYFPNMTLKKPEPEVKQTLNILEKEVAASENIISSFLDFARSKPPTRHKVDINDLLQGILSYTTIPEKIKIVSKLDRSLPGILADSDRLSQIFNNIILNALQAMLETGQLVIKSELVAIIMADYRQEIVDQVETALNGNAYSCIYKPLDIEVILKLVEEILEKKKRQDMRGGKNEPEREYLNSR